MGLVPRAESFVKGYIFGSIVSRSGRKGSSNDGIIPFVFFMIILTMVVAPFILSLIIGFIVAFFIQFDGSSHQQRFVYAMSGLFGLITYLLWGGFVFNDLFNFQMPFLSIFLVLATIGAASGVFGAWLFKILLSDTSPFPSTFPSKYWVNVLTIAGVIIGLFSASRPWIILIVNGQSFPQNLIDILFDTGSPMVLAALAAIFLTGLFFCIFSTMGSLVVWTSLVGWALWEMSYFGDFVALTADGSLTAFSYGLISASLITLSIFFPLGFGFDKPRSYWEWVTTFNYGPLNFLSWKFGDGPN